MKTALKCLGILILLVLTISALGGLTKMAYGNWFTHAPAITSGLMTAAILGGALILARGFKWIWHLSVIMTFAITLQACSYAKSNQQVVISSDCGMTWTKVDVGQSVPTGVGNRCYMKVVMPNYPMQGDSKFVTNLSEKVRANIHIDYDYSITEPLSFIKQAKYLGKANASADSEDALNAKIFEGAENLVIDKRIRDVAKGLFIHEDIVELDQAELENLLLVSSNKVLEPLGIQLNFITLTLDLDTQTRQAIDIATAMKVYHSKELDKLGEEVIAARAGATQITVQPTVVTAAE